MALRDVCAKVAHFVAEAFSEPGPEGGASSSRILIALIVFFILGAGMSLCASLHYKQITVEEFNSFLHAGGEFIVVSAGPLYAINKSSDAYKNRQ